MADIASYIGIEARKMRPTLNHRPAIWECMLGTVYAMNEEGVTEYFDYDWDDAKQHAGIPDKKDIRLFKNKRRVRWSNGDRYDGDPEVGKLTLWVEKSA